MDINSSSKSIYRSFDGQFAFYFTESFNQRGQIIVNMINMESFVNNEPVIDKSSLIMSQILIEKNK